MKYQNDAEYEQISTNQSDVPTNNYSDNQCSIQNRNYNQNQQTSHFVQLNEAFINQSEISDLPLKNYRNIQQAYKNQNYSQNQKFNNSEQSDGFEEIIVNKSQQNFHGFYNYSIPKECGNNSKYQQQQNNEQVEKDEQRQSDLPLKNYKKFNTNQKKDKYEQQRKYNQNQSNNYSNKQNNNNHNNYRNSNNQERYQDNNYYDNYSQNSQIFQQHSQYSYQNNYGRSQNQSDTFNNNQQNQRNQQYENSYSKYQQNNNYDDQYYQKNEVVFKFKTDFLRANNYLDINELRENFEPLKNFNQNHFPLEDSYFVIIRPKVGYFNLHKAVKYGIWTSSSIVNKKLSTLYKDSEMRVYLIFCPLGERTNIVGIAEMTSDYNPDASFKYWDKDGTYIGNFSIIWHYIKNISPQFIPQLKFENGYKRAFYQIEELKDGTQINYDDAINIFSAFVDAPNQPSIFPHFNNLDIQEDQLRFHKQQKSTNGQQPIGGKIIKKQYKY